MHMPVHARTHAHAHTHPRTHAHTHVEFDCRVTALIIAAEGAPIPIVATRPEFSRSLAPESCVTIIAGMATAEKSPTIFSNTATRLSVMTTATAPAAWAMLAFCAKGQVPRPITAMLPAICAAFSSGVQPNSGTATTVEAFRNSITWFR